MRTPARPRCHSCPSGKLPANVCPGVRLIPASALATDPHDGSSCSLWLCARGARNCAARQWSDSHPLRLSRTECLPTARQRARRGEDPRAMPPERAGDIQGRYLLRLIQQILVAKGFSQELDGYRFHGAHRHGNIAVRRDKECGNQILGLDQAESNGGRGCQYPKSTPPATNCYSPASYNSLPARGSCLFLTWPSCMFFGASV